jgi:Helix-turn-helix domain
MSIRVMTLVWPLHLPASQKLVLLALADNANDDGECYPSVGTLTRKCGLSERGVQGIISALRELGYLECHYRSGRSTSYTVCPDATPAPAAPPHDVHPAPSAPAPAAGAPPPPQTVHRTPAVRAPITSKKPKRRKEEEQEGAPGGALVVLHSSLPATEWDEWLTLRRKRRWPTDELTLRKQLAVLAPYDTLTQSEIINRSIQAGWQGLFPPKATGPPRKKYVPAPTVAELEAEEAARARSG